MNSEIGCNECDFVLPASSFGLFSRRSAFGVYVCVVNRGCGRERGRETHLHTYSTGALCCRLVREGGEITKHVLITHIMYTVVEKKTTKKSFGAPPHCAIKSQW